MKKSKKTEYLLAVLLGVPLGLLISTLIQLYQGEGFILDMLLEHSGHKDVSTELHSAVLDSDLEKTKELLNRGFDPGAKDEKGLTPLHIAAMIGDISVAELLVENTSDLDIRERRHGMTPYYLAKVTGHDEIAELLEQCGADISIPDDYTQTPEEAAAVFREKETHELVSAASGNTPFDHRAIVLLAYVGRNELGLAYKRGVRDAFVVEDGNLVITAAHCVTDFIQEYENGSLVRPLAISSFYGNLYETEIVAIDKDADLAALRPEWTHHVSFDLGTEEELLNSEDLLIAGYPPPQTEEDTLVFQREPYYERLRFLKPLSLHSEDDAEALLMVGAKYVGKGWSGSPVIIPESGHVVGAHCKHRLWKFKDQLILHNAMGGGIHSLESLVEKANITRAVDVATIKQNPPEDAEEAFFLILDIFEAHNNRKLVPAVEKAQELVRLRPDSAQAHSLLAWSADAAEAEKQEKERMQEIAKSSYKNSLEIEPDNAYTRTFYAAFLAGIQQKDEGIVELENAAKIDPSIRYTRLLQMDLLIEGNPAQAVELGRRLTETTPGFAKYWFKLAQALQKIGEYDEAVETVRTGIEKHPKRMHRGPLAEALAKAGRIEEAEERYNEILEGHDCSWCWLAYAKFLIEYRPERTDDAAEALDKAEEFNKKKQLVDPADIEKWRQKLDKAKAIPDDSDPAKPEKLN